LVHLDSPGSGRGSQPLPIPPAWDIGDLRSIRPQMRYARGLTQTAAVRLSCKTKNRAPDWIGAPALVRVGGSSRLSLNGLSIVSNITSEPEVVKRSDRATGAASAGVVPLWRGLDFGLGREPRIGLVVGRLWLAVRRGCTRGGGGLHDPAEIR
jgi:hypothetical protein